MSIALLNRIILLEEQIDFLKRDIETLKENQEKADVKKDNEKLNNKRSKA